MAQNAVQFRLRSAPSLFDGDGRVDCLVGLITDDALIVPLARDVAIAHLEARLIERLLAMAWEVFRDDHPARRSLSASVDDDAMAEVLDPVARQWIRGQAPVDAEERRLVARLERYAIKLRSMKADALMRRIRLLYRYQGHALRRLRAATAALDRARDDAHGAGRCR